MPCDTTSSTAISHFPAGTVEILASAVSQLSGRRKACSVGRPSQSSVKSCRKASSSSPTASSSCTSCSVSSQQRGRGRGSSISHSLTDNLVHVISAADDDHELANRLKHHIDFVQAKRLRHKGGGARRPGAVAVAEELLLEQRDLLAATRTPLIELGEQSVSSDVEDEDAVYWHCPALSSHQQVLTAVPLHSMEIPWKKSEEKMLQWYSLATTLIVD
eukprot:scaffold5636_cov159-Ochromonas_danica.AAC.5